MSKELNELLSKEWKDNGIGKKRTRGSKYSDEQVIYMAVLSAIGESKTAIATQFNTDRKSITRCIKRGYKLVMDKRIGINNPKCPISEREVELIYVGGTTELEQIEGKQHV